MGVKVEYSLLSKLQRHESPDGGHIPLLSNYIGLLLVRTSLSVLLKLTRQYASQRSETRNIWPWPNLSLPDAHAVWHLKQIRANVCEMDSCNCSDKPVDLQ